MSNIIQDYNEENNPTQLVGDVKLPTKAVKFSSSTTPQPDVNSLIPQPTSAAPEDNYVQATRDYVRYPDAPEYVPQNIIGTTPTSLPVEREQPVVDLNASQGLPTGAEIDTAVKQGFQDKLDWVRAQAGNYTKAPVFDVTGNGFDYGLDTPQLEPFVPSNLNWKEERAAQQRQAQAQYEYEVAQQQAQLNQAGYNIEPQTNVTQQQGGFNAPVGTADKGWSIGGLWQDVQGMFGLAQRAATVAVENNIGRKIQNPLDVVEGVAKAGFTPFVIADTVNTVINPEKQKQVKEAAQRNFKPQTFRKEEIGLIKGLEARKGPVNLSQGRFGDYGSGTAGALNYGLDNFLGGNTIRGFLANAKRNGENALNGRPQQWDEGLGVVAAIKGRDYSALNPNNKDTGVLGTNIHGGEFWARAAGGFVYDAVTDINPLNMVKKGLVKAGKAGLKGAINSAASPGALRQLVREGDVIVEVSKKTGSVDLTTKKLAEIMSPEKRAYYEKKGLVVVGAKQVSGPSKQKLAQQATRDAKKLGKTGKPVTRKTPKIEYEFITKKVSELEQDGVSLLTPKVAKGAPLNEVVDVTASAENAGRPRYVEGRIDDLVNPAKQPGGNRDNPIKDGIGVGKQIPRPENPLQLRREATIKQVEDVAQKNPFLHKLIHKNKPPTELVGNGEVLGTVVTKAEKTTLEEASQKLDNVVREVPPVTQYVKAVTEVADTTDVVARQLAEPGAVDNVLRQAELDGTIEIKPGGVIATKVNDGIEAAQKELIRLRMEQSNLRKTPNFDLLGQPGTKLGNQVQAIQERIDTVRQTITGGRVRREEYDVITQQNLDTLIPVIPSRTTDALPLTPSTLYTRLKTESGVLGSGEFVERSMADLSALAEFLGHRKTGLKKPLTAEQLTDLRTQYGMVYSRVGESIDRNAIKKYLQSGVGRIETKTPSVTSPRQESVVLRRNERAGLAMIEGGGRTTPRTAELSSINGGYEKLVDRMSLEELFSEANVIGSKYNDVVLPDSSERFAANRIANDLAKETLDPLRNKVAAGLENEFGTRLAGVTPLRPQAGDNVLEMVPNTDGKKYRYKSTGVSAPERGVYQKLELVRNLREELLSKVEDGVTNQTVLQKDLDTLALTKQKLEELDPTERLRTENYFDSLAETVAPDTNTVEALPIEPPVVQEIARKYQGVVPEVDPVTTVGTPNQPTVRDVRTSLLDQVDNPQIDQVGLQQDLDQLALVQNSLEGPLEAKRTAQFIDNLPEVPTTLKAKEQAVLVREAEQLVQDTTQRVRDLNLQVEALRQELDVDNAKLLDLPAVEPQPLDVGTYDLGLLSERIVGQTTIQRIAQAVEPLTELAQVIREEKLWHGSSFPDALSYGPEAVRPTRNPLGLGHYLYRSGDDAEAAARSVLPDNHIDVGMTPNENGIVQQVSADVNNTLDATTTGSTEVQYAFQQALRDTFGDDGAGLAKKWATKVEGKPVSTYWDEATLVWSKSNTGEQIPEDYFRQLEVNITNNLIDLGYDSINHPRVLVVLDGSLANELDDVLEMAPSTYTQKLVAQANTMKVWQDINPGKVADVHALNAQIEAGESLVDDTMQLLAKASADSETAVEQMLRASDSLSARLESDRVARELKLQKEGSDAVARETDSLLKRDSNEHPGCL